MERESWGTVSKVNVGVGQNVQPGSSLVTIEANGRKLAVVAQDIGQVELRDITAEGGAGVASLQGIGHMQSSPHYGSGWGQQMDSSTSAGISSTDEQAHEGALIGNAAERGEQEHEVQGLAASAQAPFFNNRRIAIACGTIIAPIAGLLVGLGAISLEAAAYGVFAVGLFAPTVLFIVGMVSERRRRRLVADMPNLTSQTHAGTQRMGTNVGMEGNVPHDPRLH